MIFLETLGNFNIKEKLKKYINWKFYNKIEEILIPYQDKDMIVMVNVFTCSDIKIVNDLNIKELTTCVYDSVEGFENSSEDILKLVESNGVIYSIFTPIYRNDDTLSHMAEWTKNISKIVKDIRKHYKFKVVKTWKTGVWIKL